MDFASTWLIDALKEILNLILKISKSLFLALISEMSALIS